MRHSFGTRPSLRRTSLALVASGIVGFSCSSFAQYEATAYVGSQQIGHTTTPGDVGYSVGGDPQNFMGVVNFTSSPIASVGASSLVTNLGGEAILAAGGLVTYRFEVTGQPFTNVPIDFSGIFTSLQQSQSSALTATSLTIQTVNSSVSTYSTFRSFFYGDCGAPTCLTFTTHNATVTFAQSNVHNVEGTFEGSLEMLTGATGRVIGLVQLNTSATSHAFFGTSGAGAYIDPHLEIDAAFLVANPGTTLTITAGVGNDIAGVTAVPEPSTHALVLAGLAAMALSAHRRAGRNGESADAA